MHLLPKGGWQDVQKQHQLFKPRNLKLLAQNTGSVLWEHTQNMLLDPVNMKNNALIISALLLVSSRIALSNIAAAKAKGTPDEKFRRTEANKTTIREGMGWILSYLVFRLLQRFMHHKIRHKLFIKDRKTLWKDFKANLITGAEKAYGVSDKRGNVNKQGRYNFLPSHKEEHFSFRDKLSVHDNRLYLELHHNELGFTREAVLNMSLDEVQNHVADLMDGSNAKIKASDITKFYERQAIDKVGDSKYLPKMKTVVEWVLARFKKTAKQDWWNKTAKTVDPVAFIKGYNKLFPLIVGAVPSLVLSGYFLERYTRDHAVSTAERITQFIEERRQKKAVKEIKKEVKTINKQNKAAFTTSPVAPGPVVPASNQTSGVNSTMPVRPMVQAAGTSSQSYQREYNAFLNSLAGV